MNKFLDGYNAKITTRTWSKLGDCSQDTALRDLQDLTTKGLLIIEDPTAKRFSYRLPKINS